MINRAKRLLRRLSATAQPASQSKTNGPHEQELNVYWDADMAAALETWGEGNAWDEIQMLLVNCKGKVLDIACGTGKVMDILSKYPELEVFGFDISDFLIEKAIARGLSPDRLSINDATSTNYTDSFFDYSYSIGSLEHFTEDGIIAFLQEARRITKHASCHQIPIARKGDEGWITPHQSYFNNSLEWWLPKFSSVFPEVHVLPSSWSDERSVGRWFICKASRT